MSHYESRGRSQDESSGTSHHRESRATSHEYKSYGTRKRKESSPSPSRDNFGDRGGEHVAPMSNHRPMPRGNAEPLLVVVSEVVGAFLVVLSGVFHGIAPDLFLGEGSRRHSSSSGLSSTAMLLDEAVHHVVRVGVSRRRGRRRCGGR